MTDSTCSCLQPWGSILPPPPCPVHAPRCTCPPRALPCPSCGGVGAHFCPGPRTAPVYYYSWNTWDSNTVVQRDTNTPLAGD